MNIGRTVSSDEIHRTVEGYANMSRDAFDRRFYSDRSDLTALGIIIQGEAGKGSGERDDLQVDRYSIREENFHLPRILFSKEEREALSMMLELFGQVDFAYAEPLAVAMRAVLWGNHPQLETQADPDQMNTVALAVGGGSTTNGERKLINKLESAISRYKNVRFKYDDVDQGRTVSRRVSPYSLLHRDNAFWLVGLPIGGDGQVRLFKASRMHGLAYITKAEHDFDAPEGFSAAEYANQAAWQFSEANGSVPVKTAVLRIDKSISWQVSRSHGRFGQTEEQPDGSMLFTTTYCSSKEIIGFVLGMEGAAQILKPVALKREAVSRTKLIRKAHAAAAPQVDSEIRIPDKKLNDKLASEEDDRVRPERIARLISLAAFLLDAARRDETPSVKVALDAFSLTKPELCSDLDILNIVNFGGGAYSLYAEISGDEIVPEVESYSDWLERPVRLLPIEARALIAALDIVGGNLMEGALKTAKDKVVEALGLDPLELGLLIAESSGDNDDIARVCSKAISERVKVRIRYVSAGAEVLRTVSPYALINGTEGWYLAGFDSRRQAARFFRLDRIRKAALTADSFEKDPKITKELSSFTAWASGGALSGATSAEVLINSRYATEAQERYGDATRQCKDGSVVVLIPYVGTSWLATEMLKAAGEATVLSPAEARTAVSAAAQSLCV